MCIRDSFKPVAGPAGQHALARAAAAIGQHRRARALGLDGMYMLIAAILMGLLAYLIYSLKIIYSIAWSLEEVVTELVIPMVLICVSLNIAISVFWGSGLLLSDTNIDSMLALPIPLRTLILSKLTVLFMVEVALTVALLLPSTSNIKSGSIQFRMLKTSTHNS